ncbi:MAG TPA: GAF domain-containing protein [Roseiflexaceae bacterium]|nr:GAF domain-containing protein [Roseiflexaceae bacterium]
MSSDDTMRAELGRARAELLAVLAVSQTLRASRDMQSLYRVVAIQLASIINFDSLFIALYLPESNNIRFEYSQDEGIIDDEIFERSLETAPLIARIIRTRRPLSIDDLDADPVRTSGKLIPFGNIAKRSRAWLGVPMISGDEPQGVLSIQSYNPAAFRNADTELLLLVSAQISVAIENARLFRRLRRTLAELSTPLLPIATGVLLLPLIGTIDAERALRTAEQTLDAIVAQQAEQLLIDITGVARLDRIAIELLQKLVRAAELLGVRSSIVGIHSDMAQTLAGFGLDLRQVRTFDDLRSALHELLFVRGS